MARGAVLLRKSLLRPLTSHLRRPPPSQHSTTPLSHHSIPTPPKPSLSRTPNPFFSFSSPFPRHTFSSSTAGSSSIVIVKSEEELNNSLEKAQGGGLPAIFYFTAAWCGPCRVISPVIEELSKKYPHVTTYKIDIDLEGLSKALSELKIAAVPTLYFFNNGKKAAEVVGADAAKLKQTTENLYK